MQLKMSTRASAELLRGYLTTAHAAMWRSGLVRRVDSTWQGHHEQCNWRASVTGNETYALRVTASCEDLDKSVGSGSHAKRVKYQDKQVCTTQCYKFSSLVIVSHRCAVPS